MEGLEEGVGFDFGFDEEDDLRDDLRGAFCFRCDIKDDKTNDLDDMVSECRWVLVEIQRCDVSNCTSCRELSEVETSKWVEI